MQQKSPWVVFLPADEYKSSPPVCSVLVSNIGLIAGLYTQGKMTTNQSSESCKSDHAQKIVAKQKSM